MNEQEDRGSADNDALEALALTVARFCPQVREVTHTLRRMTGAGIRPIQVAAFRHLLLHASMDLREANRAANDLHRRAANPREGGES